MALLLNIDTSTGQASICVTDNGQALSFLSNPNQIDHASWLHTAIRQALGESGRCLEQIEAIAVTAGPGSYTGLRVGLASAKGLCYALQLPLITINTLEVMAFAARQKLTEIVPLAPVSSTGRGPGTIEMKISDNTSVAAAPLICPMIDARRMEVFTALYDTAFTELIKPCAMILEENSFKEYLETRKILFFGNGSNKWEKIRQHPNAIFKNIFFTAANLALMAEERFKTGDFSPLAWSEPIYIKEFYTPPQVQG